jgi:lysine 2,3-aminomutase
MKNILSWEDIQKYNVEDQTWQEALGGRFNHHSELTFLNDVEEVEPQVYNNFDFKLTRYVAQLMDKDDPNCPIRKQYLPSNREIQVKPYEIEDSLGEDASIHDKSSTVVHRYPQRVLFLVYNTCGAICRYCTRKRFVTNDERAVQKDQIEHGIEYIASHTEIEDVLLSGGDPLLLSDKRLDYILGRIRSDAPHVKFLRIGSRLPVQLPTRITPQFCQLVEKHDVQMINVHVNHPKEITPVFSKYIKILRKTGVMIGNQTVLLKGVNDDVETLKSLFMGLLEVGIRPYYTYTNDNAEGNWQFTIPLEKTLEMIYNLRGRISGPAMPTFVVDGIGGLGKMPISPQYVQKMVDGSVYATNYEGKTVRQINLE